MSLASKGLKLPSSLNYSIQEEVARNVQRLIAPQVVPLNANTHPTSQN